MAKMNLTATKPGNEQAIAAESSDSGTVKDRIIEAALQSFADMGFDGASIGDIARQCGISTPSVHYHFSSKLLLWQAAVTVGMNEISRGLAPAMEDYSDLDAIARFKIFTRKYINFIFRRPQIFGIIMQETDSQGERFLWLREHFLEQFYSLWNERIADLRDSGKLTLDVPDYHIAQLIAGACNHFLTSRFRVLPLFGRDPDDGQLAPQHAYLVIHLVLNGLLQTGATPSTD